VSIEDDIVFIERVPTLRTLGHDALRILAIGAESRYVHKGEVLFLAGERNLWSRHLAVAAGLAVVAVVLLCVWAVIELRSTTPLVDVRAVRHPAVAGANLAMFVGGIGMYLLLTLITRYVQTPHGAGYGFGLTTFVAGLVLIPFSVLGFVAGKLTPRVRTRIADPLLLAGSAVVVGGGFALFAAARSAYPIEFRRGSGPHWQDRPAATEFSGRNHR